MDDDGDDGGGCGCGWESGVTVVVVDSKRVRL